MKSKIEEKKKGFWAKLFNWKTQLILWAVVVVITILIVANHKEQCNKMVVETAGYADNANLCKFENCNICIDQTTNLMIDIETRSCTLFDARNQTLCTGIEND